MTDEAPTAPPLRPGIGYPGIDWSGDGGLGGEVAKPAPPAPTGVVSASIRLRAVGFGIDMLILLGIAVVISMVVLLVTGVDTNAPQAELERQLDDLYPLLYLLQGITQFGYNLLWNTKGWSPGKRVVGLRIVDAEGNPPTFRHGLMRSLGTLLSGAFFGLGYVWAIRDRQHRTWHDHIGKTYVVRAAPQPADIEADRTPR